MSTRLRNLNLTCTGHRRLSPKLRSLLDGLMTVHSSEKMINHARASGGWARKDPVNTVHPLIRVHPVTGEKCLYLNGEFLTKIIGLKEPESKVLLDFLLQHIISGHDFQARIRWSPRTVVMFDNRSTIRKAILSVYNSLCGKSVC
jgi:sulfonate dioxygenase